MRTIDSILGIIPPPFRRRGLRVAATILLRACLNLVGLAVLLPVLVLVLDPSSLEGSGPAARAYTLSGIRSPHGFVLAVCGAVVAVIVLKCLANLTLARAERRYIYDLYRALSRRLYITYHDRGLAFVKRSHSAVLTRNVNVVCLAFAAGVLKPAASIAAEAMLFILLFTALAVYTPLAALLAVAVFLPAMWLYYGLVRNRINRYGEEENRAQREKSRLVAETFRGYADIEINDAFPQMLRSFDRAMDEVVRTRLREAAIGMLPQALTEIGLAAGMALLVAFSIGRGGNVQLLFGVFAVAALRLMPSVRGMLAAWTTIRYNRYTIDILREAQTAGTTPANAGGSSDNRTTPDRSVGPQAGSETARGIRTEKSSRSPRTASPALPEQTTDKLPFEHEIAVRELSFRFEDDSRELFHGLSLTIRKGERVGIRGVSGAGKTTLFNLLLGLYEPTAGQITIDGVPLTAANRRAWQNRIGYVSQNLFLCDGTFAENVALGTPPELIDRARAAEALEAARMGDFIAALPQGMDTPVGECGCRLSGGQRQRIGIARALYRRSDVLFFDEATSALDSRTEEEINRSIASIACRQAGMTLIVIAHRESSLDFCDRIITLGQ